MPGILHWVWSVVAVASCAFSKPVAEPQATISPGLSDHSAPSSHHGERLLRFVSLPALALLQILPSLLPVLGTTLSSCFQMQTLLKGVVLHLGTVVDHLTWDVLGNTLYWDFRIILARYDELYPLLPTFPLWLEKSTKLRFFICI